jgi:hypothetical protein
MDLADDEAAAIQQLEAGVVELRRVRAAKTALRAFTPHQNFAKRSTSDAAGVRHSSRHLLKVPALRPAALAQRESDGRSRAVRITSSRGPLQARLPHPAMDVRHVRVRLR